MLRGIARASPATRLLLRPPLRLLSAKSIAALPQNIEDLLSPTELKELKEFRAWKKAKDADLAGANPSTTLGLDVDKGTESNSLMGIDATAAAFPSAAQTTAVFLVAAASTPAVLLLPSLCPLVFVESVATYFADPSAIDGLPFWTLRSAFALAAHPAITLTCGAACAAAFASQRNVLATAGWVESAAGPLGREAAKLGGAVGFSSALVSPLAVFATHAALTYGALDGLMPRALALDYWGQTGGFGTFSYVFVLYIALMPVTTWCASQIGPMTAPALFGPAAERAGLMRGAIAALLLFSALSFYMHRRWEFALLRTTDIPGASVVDEVVENSERAKPTDRPQDDPCPPPGGQTPRLQPSFTAQPIMTTPRTMWLHPLSLLPSRSPPAIEPMRGQDGRGGRRRELEQH